MRIALLGSVGTKALRVEIGAKVGEVGSAAEALRELIRTSDDSSHQLTRNQKRQIDMILDRISSVEDRVSAPMRSQTEYEDMGSMLEGLTRRAEIALREFGANIGINNQKESASRTATMAQRKDVPNEDTQKRIKVKTRPAQEQIADHEVGWEPGPEATSENSTAKRSYPMRGSILKSIKKLPEEDRTLDALEYMIRARGGEMSRRNFVSALVACGIDVHTDIGADYKLVNTKSSCKPITMNNDEGENLGAPYMLIIIRKLQQEVK